MAPLTWRFSATVPAPADAVYQWMTEFREDDHSRPGYLAATGEKAKPGREARRRVMSRDGNVVVLEDQWNGRTFISTARLDPVAREVHIEAQMGYTAVWRAVAEGAVTRYEVEGRVAPRGLFGLLLPLFKRSMLRQVEQDFKGHVADLEGELVARPPAR